MTKHHRGVQFRVMESVGNEIQELHGRTRRGRGYLGEGEKVSDKLGAEPRNLLVSVVWIGLL